MTDKYSLNLRILHWLTAILIIGMLAIGYYMTDLPKDDPSRGLIYGLHKSFGVVIIGLFFIRVLIRKISHIPAMPRKINKLEQKAAHIVHYILYFFMFSIPVSGYAASNLYGKTVKLFGIDMPILLDKNPELGSIASFIHVNFPPILIALISLHLIGALKHYFFDKENIFKRMI
jgi:cytochrome b561